MKYLFSLLAVLIAVNYSFAQTNTFPSNGNVGIGTTSPTAGILQVNGSGDLLTLYSNTGVAQFNAYNNSDFRIIQRSNAVMSFWTNTVERIRIDANGNVGIGTAGSTEKLTVRDQNIAYDSSSGIVKLLFDSGNGGGGVGFEKETFNTGGLRFFTQYGWGSTLEKMRITANGNVGIGTTNPGYKLDIAGTSNATGQSWFSYGNTNMSGYSWTNSALTTNSIEIVNNNGTVNNLAPTLAFHRYGSGGPQFRLAADGSCVLYLESAGANSARNPAPYGGGPNSYFTRLHIDGALTTTGNVGIGTTDTKGYTFAVNGSAIATSMPVKLYSAWPDYVFKPKYNLSSLTEVKNYIDKNHRLPDMPSEQEVIKNGLDLGEMNKLLVKKVEELTLYLIQQKEETDKQINELKSQLAQLIKQK